MTFCRPGLRILCKLASGKLIAALKKHLDTILTALLSLVFLLFYFYLASKNRFASDDYDYLTVFKQQGGWGSLAYYYSHQTFRFSSIMIFDIFFGYGLTCFSYQLMIFSYHLLTMGLLVYSVYNLLTGISQFFFKTMPSVLFRLLASISFVTAFFFASFQITDTWFWLISSCVHLLACSFGILLISSIIKQGKRIITYMTILFCAAFVGGSSENFALFIIIALLGGIILLMFLKAGRSDSACRLIMNKFIFAFAVTLLAFMLNLSGSGIQNRMRNINETKVASTQRMDKTYDQKEYSFHDIHKNIFQKKSILFMLVSFVFFLLGYLFKQNRIVLMKQEYFSIPKYLKIVLPFMIIGIIIILLPVFITFKGPGPMRAWIPVSLLLAVFFSGLFFIWGYNSISLKLYWASRLSLILSVVFIVLYFARQYNVAGNYASCYDARIDQLTQMQHDGNRDTVNVKGFPDSGMLPNGDITEVSDDPLNLNFCKAFDLNFKVYASDNYFLKYDFIKNK